MIMLSFGHFYQEFLKFDMNHDWSGGGSDEGDCRDDGAGIGQVLDNIEGEELSDPDLYSMLHPGRYWRLTKLNSIPFHHWKSPNQMTSPSDSA